MNIRDACTIVGIGQTNFSRNSGRSELALAVEACKKAVDDAGLKMTDIDGLCYCDMDSVTHQAMANALGIKDLGYFGIGAQGGTAPCQEIVQAIGALLTGQSKYVLCMRSINGYSGARYGQASGTRALRRVGGAGTLNEFFVPYGMVSAGQFYGIAARQHMLDYGTTKDQLGAIALTCREHANQNPNAQMFDRPMSMEDYRQVRMISEPLNLFDYCLETDGAAAVVVTTAERAKDLRQAPVYISGAAMGSGPNPQGGVWFPAMMRDNVTDLPAARSVAEKIYTQAGVGPSDMDVAQFYDCFTITVLLQIEAYGFAKRGEAGAFVEGGERIGLGGQLPLNTSGGHLSEAYIHGMNHIVEGVRQMRGTSTAQVEDASYCLVTSAPHPPTAAIILRRD